MRKHYDFANARPNPYVRRLKKQVTLRLETSTLEYFKNLSDELGIPYQRLIGLYLRDCAQAAKKLRLKWG